MRNRLVLLACVTALVFVGSSQAFAAWKFWGHDEEPWANDSVQVKQDEYQWISGYTGIDAVPDDVYTEQNFPWADGIFLYKYTVINNSFAQTLESFGFTEGFAGDSGGGVQEVRAVGQAASFGFEVAEDDGTIGVYWDLGDDGGTGIPTSYASEGFQIVAWGTPYNWYEAEVDYYDNGTKKYLTGRTSGPTPEPSALLLLGLGAIPIAALLRRRKS